MSKMRFAAVAAALAASAVAMPAMAKTYTFSGNFGDPVFSYGTVATNNAVTLFTPSNCSDINVSTLCYRGSDRFQVEFQRDAANLLIHPGPGDGQNSFLLFTAPVSTVYTFSATFNRVDSGDGVNLYTYNSNDAGLTFITRIDAGMPTVTYAGSQFIAQGTTVGIGIDRGGASSTYFNDSTTLGGFISGAVPEPATWAMMIAGFGMVGFALRRRSAVKTSVRYA